MVEARTGPAAGIRWRHEALRDLLDRNGILLELLAEMQLDLRVLAPSDPRLRTRTRDLLEATLIQAQALNLLSGDRYRRLYGVHAGIESRMWRILEEESERLRTDPITVPLDRGGDLSPSLVGGKAARLGALRARLPRHVPGGFVVTSAAWSRFLAHEKAGSSLRALMKGLDLAIDGARLGALAAEAQGVLLEAPIPEEVEEAIRDEARRGGGALWAVRSSAVGEDGAFSFAGQFATLLHVPGDRIVPAWRRVIASSFSEHAIRYRLACGMFELASPMAVLCMPMVGARTSGVLYTRDPSDPGSAVMLVDAVQGLASELVEGVVDVPTLRVSRESQRVDAAPGGGVGALAAQLSESDLAGLARLGLECEEVFRGALDVEWAIDGSGTVQVLQARPLAAAPPTPPGPSRAEGPGLARGGVTIVGGRAVGEIFTPGARGTDTPPPGGILVAEQAAPELGHLLPRVEGLVTEHGSMTGHLASLAREFGVPTVFGMKGVMARLSDGERVSLDATECVVHPGEAWPAEDPESRRRARELRSGAGSPLRALTLRLHLTDPRAASFRSRGCRSLHDIVRLCHERGIAATFEGGGWRRGADGARRLRGAAFPEGVWVIDAGGGIVPATHARKDLEAAEVLSRPFQALWRGMTTPGIAWSGRRSVDLRGFASVVTASLTEADRDAESLGGAAYLVVAADYLNLNARMAYHYAMVDALVGGAPDGNYVRFRFWGGGAGRSQRDRRAIFLTEVLERSGFSVDRRGDLVTSRLQRHSGQRSEEGLELLGRLMGCARQLDMMLGSEGAVRSYVDRFMSGDYEAFE